MIRVILVAIVCLFSYLDGHDSTVLHSKYPWLRLPATPQLPSPVRGAYLPVDDVLIWYTIYGSDDSAPLLFLHGGFGQSAYWGSQVAILQSSYRCILMDSRGQGRSTLSSTSLTYDLMTSDVIALLDHLGIQSTHLVGWSDGAIIGLNLAMNHSSRLRSLFAFAANYDLSGTKDVFSSPVFLAYLARTKREYNDVNPSPNYPNLYNNLTTMWSTMPNWTKQDFTHIDQTLPVWVVDADHEEVIDRNQPDTMASWIAQAGELILPRTSHFAFLQDANFFTICIERFLYEVHCPRCLRQHRATINS